VIIPTSISGEGAQCTVSSTGGDGHLQEAFPQQFIPQSQANSCDAFLSHTETPPAAGRFCGPRIVLKNNTTKLTHKLHEDVHRPSVNTASYGPESSNGKGKKQLE